MLFQRILLLLLCHGKPTEAQYGLLRDFLKYWSNLHVSHCCSRSCQLIGLRNEPDLPDSLGSEPNHTAHDIHGVRAFVAFDRPLKISKIEFYKHEQS